MPKREHSSTDSQSKSSPSTLNKTDKGHDDTVTIKRLKLENKELTEEFNNLKNELNSTKQQLFNERLSFAFLCFCISLLLNLDKI